MSIESEIEFENNPEKVCYSGQLLKGKVKIFFPVDTQVQEIYLKFCGEGSCEWRGQNGKLLKGTKTYLSQRCNLIRSSDSDIVVSAGSNCYNFETQLPHFLSTSYEGTFGHVRYMVMVHINLPTEKVKPFREIFTVIKTLNLSNSNTMRMPSKVLKIARFNRFCLFDWWNSDELRIYGNLPVIGYCSGQIINLRLDVINPGGQLIQMFLVELFQDVTYNSNDGTKKIETITLSKCKCDGPEPDRHSIQSVRIDIKVPSVPPSTFLTADYICEFAYRFQVTAITDCCHHNPKFEIPIIIGTYPVSSVETRATERPLFDASEFPVEPALNENDYSDVTPPFPEEDPPTYEDALYKSSCNRHFVPKYPMYRRATS